MSRSMKEAMVFMQAEGPFRLVSHVIKKHDLLAGRDHFLQHISHSMTEVIVFWTI